MGDGNDGERQLLLIDNVVSNYTGDRNSVIGSGDSTGDYADNP